MISIQQLATRLILHGAISGVLAQEMPTATNMLSSRFILEQRYIPWFTATNMLSSLKATLQLTKKIWWVATISFHASSRVPCKHFSESTTPIASREVFGGTPGLVWSYTQYFFHPPPVSTSADYDSIIKLITIEVNQTISGVSWASSVIGLYSFLGF